jgi:hypothetical protein
MSTDMNPSNREAAPAEGPMTDAELRALPPVIDLTTAARLLGVGKTTAHELARTGRWPTPVLRFGAVTRVPTAPLLALVQARTEPPRPIGPGRLVWHERGDLGGGL